MYEFVDRPVSSLNRGGRLLIWAMRHWVSAVSAGRCPCGDVGPIFHKWKLMPGFPHFHILMALLNRNAVARLRFGPVDCERVHEDEALIISLVRAAHEQPLERMQGMASLIVCKGSTPPLLIAAAALAQALLDAGLWPAPPIHDPDYVSFPHE